MLLPAEMGTAPRVNPMKAFAIGFLIAMGFSAVVTFPIVKQYTYEAVLDRCKHQVRSETNAESDLCIEILAAQR